MGPLLTALGLMLVVVEDADAMRQFTSRILKTRHDASVRMRPTGRHIKWARIGPQWAAMMNARRYLKLSPMQRKASARTAAKARWRIHGHKSSRPPWRLLTETAIVVFAPCGFAALAQQSFAL
jgi:hypothetical protein